MIDAISLEMGSLLAWALAEVERLGGGGPQVEDGRRLLLEQQTELERFERWIEEQEESE